MIKWMKAEDQMQIVRLRKKWKFESEFLNIVIVYLALPQQRNPVGVYLRSEYTASALPDWLISSRKENE